MRPSCAPSQTGVGADRVLITWGVISEETYVAALAASLGMAFEPLFNTPREQCPLSGRRADRGRQHRDAAAVRTATASDSWWRRGWSTAAAWSLLRPPAPRSPGASA